MHKVTAIYSLRTFFRPKARLRQAVAPLGRLRGVPFRQRPRPSGFQARGGGWGRVFHQSLLRPAWPGWGKWDGALGPASPGLRGLGLGHWGPFWRPRAEWLFYLPPPHFATDPGSGPRFQSWNRGLAQGLALNCLFPFHHWALEPEPHGSPTSWSVGSRLCLLLPLSKARPGTQAQLVAASQRAWGPGPAGGL